MPLTRFVGRETELARVTTLLETTRLLTLTGTGGIGKTRLAVESAARARHAYADGVWLVELASLAEPAIVAQAVAEPLGLRAGGDVPLGQVLLEFLRPRRLLLVLDNCEHLIGACATLADALLRACPDLRILATSREPLRIAGEVTWRVPALTVPGQGIPPPPETLLEYESVRLFADRASAGAGFELTPLTAPIVARLCQRLDGIPLAIELAAARAGVLSVAQIEARLDDRFRLLVGGSRTAPARQQTLQAALDWSFDMLAVAEQRLLCRLSAFASGWTLQAAESVCAGEGIMRSDVLDLLARLVEKSLVLAEPAAEGQMRYRLLESVRQYGWERLRADGAQASAAQHRHCAYYRELAEEVEAHVVWGTDEVEWRDKLDPELGNLRAALGWSLSESGDPAASLELAGRLGHYWYTRGDRAEGREWLGRALARTAASAQARELTRTPAWAWALLWAGALAHGQSRYDEAMGMLQRALESFDRLGDPRGTGWALSFLGHVERARSNLDQAVALLERAVAVFRAIGDDLNAISPLSALGFTVGALGDQHRATELLEESVALARRTGSGGRLAIASLYLGQVAYARGDASRAAAAWGEGLRLARAWGSPWGLAECLEGLALVAGAAGQAGRAARLLGAATRLRASVGAPVHPVDRPDQEQLLAAVRTALGERAFAAERATGEGMELDEVVEYAIGGGPAGPGSPSAGPPPEERAARLTAREREVAALIARGLSNREIAERLVIAERTATNHVEHILDKLGFRSRTQVAVWATEQRLVGARR